MRDRRERFLRGFIIFLLGMFVGLIAARYRWPNLWDTDTADPTSSHQQAGFK